MKSDRQTIFSADRIYRYQLWRDWTEDALELEERDGNNSAKAVLFIGLNPSTADETKDDPTIRRCIGFAKSWGYGSLCMANLFAFRATLPKDMMAAKDPIGPQNDHFLKHLAKDASLIVCAWGRGGSFAGRGIAVCAMLRESGVPIHHLGLNSDWSPKHPLYLASSTQPEPYAL